MVPLSVPGPHRRSKAKKKDPTLVKAIGSVSLQKLPQEEAMKLLEVFMILDSGKTGFLDKDNLVIFFRSMGWVWSDDEVEMAVLASLGGGKRESMAHLVEKKQKWSMPEVLRMADRFYKDRFDVKRDKQGVLDSFTSFSDPEGDVHMMRADLQKILGNDQIPKMDRLLLDLGYERKQLGFELDEIGERMADFLDEPFQPEFTDRVAIA
jgi:hypothetical protein